MLRRSSIFAAFLLSTVTLSVSAADAGVSLQAGQLKSLGVETLVVGENTATRAGSYPAQIRVPNEQMRVVAAPVGGMVEMLAVAPGSTVKRGQVLAHLASPQALELQRDALQSSSQSALWQQNRKRDEQLFAEGLIAESRLHPVGASLLAAADAAMYAAKRRRHGRDPRTGD